METNQSKVSYRARIARGHHNSTKTVSEEEYLGAVEARSILLAATHIEEIYELLIENYLEFEKELLLLAAEGMVKKRNMSHGELFAIKRRAGRRIVNLLTAARLYVDQLPQLIKHCCGNIPDSDRLIKAMLSAEYDSNFGYRFMEALRNRVQHSGMPIDSMRAGADGMVENSSVRHSVEILSSKKLLLGTGFKSSILNEMPERVDLKKAVREHVTSLSSVHANVRSIFAESTETAAKKIIEKISAHVGKTQQEFSLSIIKLDCEEEVEYVPVSAEWERTLAALIDRNGAGVRLDNQFVTNELLADPYAGGPDTSKAAPTFAK